MTCHITNQIHEHLQRELQDDLEYEWEQSIRDAARAELLDNVLSAQSMAEADCLVEDAHRLPTIELIEASLYDLGVYQYFILRDESHRMQAWQSLIAHITFDALVEAKKDDTL